MAVLRYLLCVAVVAASLRSTEALTKEDMGELYQKILPHITECSKEYGLAEGELKDAKNEGKVDGIDSCFFACVFKKTQMMNDKGLLDVEKSKAMSKDFLKDEKDVATANEVIDDCSSVNSEDVSDGDAGCDRAKLLLACLDKHKGKFWTGDL